MSKELKAVEELAITVEYTGDGFRATTPEGYGLYYHGYGLPAMTERARVVAAGIACGQPIVAGARPVAKSAVGGTAAEAAANLVERLRDDRELAMAHNAELDAKLAEAEAETKRLAAYQAGKKVSAYLETGKPVYGQDEAGKFFRLA